MDGKIEPLTAEEQAELVSHAKYLIGIYPPTESETITLRWAATVQAKEHHNVALRAQIQVLKGAWQERDARTAELEAERDAWREDHDMWRDGFMVTKAR
ncbi:hypothetical protein KKF82_05310, partial [Patescibacteria group bacterium]|nr:hypothetical protein [Patescibacteria group bacterium]